MESNADMPMIPAAAARLLPTTTRNATQAGGQMLDTFIFLAVESVTRGLSFSSSEAQAASSF